MYRYVIEREKFFLFEFSAERSTSSGFYHLHIHASDQIARNKNSAGSLAQVSI